MIIESKMVTRNWSVKKIDSSVTIPCLLDMWDDMQTVKTQKRERQTTELK